MYQNNRHCSHKRRSQRLIEARASKKRLQHAADSIYTATLSLPTEILLLVISHLPPQWRLSLALTCRFFTQLTRRSTLPRLEGKDLVEFLSTLQRDIPNMYFCYCCHKLRTLDPNLDWKSQAHSGTAGAFENSHWLPYQRNILHTRLPKSFPPRVSNSTISFMEANLAMSRHFHGFSHGISLQSLARYETSEDAIDLGMCIKFRSKLKRKNSNDIVGTKTQLVGESLEAVPRREKAWRFSFRSSPKIIDDELFIARFYTLTGPPVSQEQLKKLMESTSIPICSHLTCSAFPSCCYLTRSLPRRYLRCCPYILSKIPHYDDDGKLIEFDPERDSCLLCSTDYDISLDLETNNETTIKISIYHCLGSCRSPSDQLWDYFVNPLPKVSRQYLIRDFNRNHGHQPYIWEFMTHNFKGSPLAQELRSRRLKLDRGVARRKWHEGAQPE